MHITNTLRNTWAWCKSTLCSEVKHRDTWRRIYTLKNSWAKSLSSNLPAEIIRLDLHLDFGAIRVRMVTVRGVARGIHGSREVVVERTLVRINIDLENNPIQSELEEFYSIRSVFWWCTKRLSEKWTHLKYLPFLYSIRSEKWMLKYLQFMYSIRSYFGGVQCIIYKALLTERLA